MKTPNAATRFTSKHKPFSQLSRGFLLPAVLALVALVARPVLAQTITWAGQDSAIGPSDSLWNYSATDWTNGGTYVAYADTTNVVFDDTAPGSTSVSLAGPVFPASVVVNNSLLSYAIGGAGSISGNTSLTKSGSGTLIVGTANTFSNGVSLNGGTLVLGINQNANVSGPLGVTNGVTNPNMINFAGGWLAFTHTNQIDYSPRFNLTGSQTYNINLNGTSAVTFASVFAGNNTTFNITNTGASIPGALEPSTTCSLTLSGANTFTCPAGVPITLSGGQFRTGSGTPYGNGANPIVELTPNSQIYLNNAATYANPMTIMGYGTWEDNVYFFQAGAISLRKAGTILTGTITLAGNACMSARSSGTGVFIQSQITDGANDYALEFGRVDFATSASTGVIILSNTTANANNWHGNTIISDGTLEMGVANQIPNGTGFGDVVMTNAGTTLLATIAPSVFDLNGFNQTINGLQSATNGTGDPSQLSKLMITNGSASTAASLTVGKNNASGNYGAVIVSRAAAPLSLVKIGSGTQILSGTNTYTGSTVVGGGTLQLAGGGSIGNTSALTITNNSKFIMNASMSVSSSVSITNGTLNTTMVSAGSARITTATLNIGGTANVIQVSNFPPIGLYPVSFPIIQYTTLNGSATNFTASLAAGYSGYISNDVPGKVELVLTSGVITPIITWFGSSGGSLSSSWDYSTTDWTNTITQAAAAYTDFSIINLDDTAQTNVVNLTAAFTPLGMSINNNALNYTLVGSGSIAGTNGVTKAGSGTLVLDNTGTNTFNGGLTISAGTLQVGNNDTNGSVGTGQISDTGSLVFKRTNNVVLANVISGSGSISQVGTNSTLTLSGANPSFSGTVLVTNNSTLQAGNAQALGTSVTTVASGSSLDVNGNALAGAQVMVSGNGVLNGDSTINGAIINSSASSAGPPSVKSVTLLGDTVFGAPTASASLPCVSVFSNRWDITGTGASLSGAHNITKVSLNQVSISGATVDPALGNIDVQNGILSIEAATTGLGDPSKTLTVENGATLSINNATNQFNKNIVLNGNGINNNLGTVNNTSGNNIIGGPVTVNGDVQITFRNNAGNAAGGALVISNLATGMSGSGSLTKNDTNTLTVGGLDTHSGGTIVNDGTFILNGMSTAAANSLTINTHTLAVATTLGGNGTNKGPVVVNDTMWPGVGGKPSSFGAGNGTVSPSFQFVPGASVIFNLGSTTTAGGGVNDLINVAGDFDAGGANVQINPVGVLTTSGAYTLANYTGSMLSSSFNPGVNVALAAQPSRYVFSVSYPAHQVQLTVTTGAGLLEWNNAANNGLWDVKTSQNWTNLNSPTLNAVDHQFEQADQVLFDDSIIAFGSGAATNRITIVTNNPVMLSPVLPSFITVNSTTNYVFTSTNGGSIGGTVNILKMGSSTLRIDNANTFVGTVTITNGSILVNNANAFGSTNTVVVVTNSGTLDVGGPSFAANANPLLGYRLVELSGFGASGPNTPTLGALGANSNGCVINTSTLTQENSMQNVLLTGDTAIGGVGVINGAGRFDIGRATPNSFSTGGHPYNLYKVGPNQVSFVACTIDTNLGNIDIQGGWLGFESASTSMGNPGSNVTVEAGATLETFSDTTNVYTKQFIINGNGVTSNIWNNSALASFNGTMTLNNTCVFGGGGTATTNYALIKGAGALVRMGAATLILTTNETYSGNTMVGPGTLSLVGNASVSNSPSIILGAGTVDVSGRADLGLTLNGAAGQSLVAGSTFIGGSITTNTGGTTVSTINGNLTNSVGSTLALAPTTTNFVILTVNYNAALNGTTVLKISPGGPTNDVLNVKTNLTYGGALTVTTNGMGGTLAAGMTFKLFNAASYNGSFTTLNLPPVSGLGLAWTNGLAVDGRIGLVSVVPLPPPGGIGIKLQGTNVMVSGSNMVNGATIYVLMSTNVALSLSQWTPVSTNVVNTNGAPNNGFTFTATNVVFTNDQQQFYILSNTN